MATCNDNPANSAWTSHALEWGIGSIVIAVLILVALPLGVAATAVALAAFHGAGGRLSIANIEELFIGVEVGGGIFWLTAVIGFCFGWRGLRQARARCLPAGVPATGAVLNFMIAVGLGVAVGATFAYHHNTMKTLRGRGLFGQFQTERMETAGRNPVENLPVGASAEPA